MLFIVSQKISVNSEVIQPKLGVNCLLSWQRNGSVRCNFTQVNDDEKKNDDNKPKENLFSIFRYFYRSTRCQSFLPSNPNLLNCL